MASPESLLKTWAANLPLLLQVQSLLAVRLRIHIRALFLLPPKHLTQNLLYKEHKVTLISVVAFYAQI